jgi:PRTRC genetic system protein B
VRLEPLPEAQIDIYPHQVVLTRRVNGRWRSYPVAPEGIAQALAGLPLASGLLPPDALGWGMAHGEPYVVRYLAPRAVALPLRIGMGVTTYHLQTPPLVWAGRGADYRLWALNVPERPTRAGVPLCRAPFPNSYEGGGICWGSADKPPAATSSANLDRALACFLSSEFSMHVDNEKSRKYPTGIVSLWKELSAETPYPLDDLVATGYDLAWLLAGGPWGGGS